MRLRRREVAPLPPERVRTLAAREGWLVESPDALRAGFGRRLLCVRLDEGLEGAGAGADALAGVELSGEDGPSGTGVVAFATLPFDRSLAGQLDVPEYVLTQTADGRAFLTSPEDSPDPRERIEAVELPTQGLQAPVELELRPTPEGYARLVARAVEELRTKELDKVVLARAVRGAVGAPIDPGALAARLRRREAVSTLYSLPTPERRRFVGASPELLARRRGTEVRCHPLAGTIALPSDGAAEGYGEWLLHSGKNLHEHAVVVDEIVARLAEIADDVDVDPAPSIVALGSVAHLGTWIVAHGDPAPDALAVARLLHPTAAVGGRPRDEALAALARLERHDRGHFAGPLGWVDAQGDGEWWLGLRGVVLDGAQFEAWAGAGIVPESDPIAEREETRNKLAVVLSALLSESV